MLDQTSGSVRVEPPSAVGINVSARFLREVNRFDEKGVMLRLDL